MNEQLILNYRRKQLREYAAQLQANHKTLDWLVYAEPDRYKQLAAYLMHNCSRIGEKLDQLILYSIDFVQQEPEEQQSVHHARGVEVMADRRRLAGLYGSTARTWGRALDKLCGLGLIRKYIPCMDAEWQGLNTPQQQYSVVRALRKGEGSNPVYYYHVEAFTEDVLAEADRRAGIMRQQLNRGRLDKEAARRLFGSEVADAIFGDHFSIHPDELKRRETLRNALETGLKINGYMTKDELTNAAQAAFESPRWRWQNTWKAYSAFLWRDTGTTYSRPSRAEKQAYGLTGDTFIIRRNGDGSC